MKQLVDFFKDKTVNTVLDVGTGTGNFLKVLKEVFVTAQIIGVDPNADSLQEAEKLYPEITFQKMVAEKLEFDDNSFDAASISMALHHLPDVQKGLQEIRRVVKPNGWIIVNELFGDNLNPAQEVHKMYHHFGSSIDRILGVNHNSSFKKEDILYEIQGSGIAVQFHFEHKKEFNLIGNSEELEARVEKMKEKLESVKAYSKYELLKPQIKEFREKAAKYGFQPATK
ncbi:MAG: methyltransferase domain-containing protein, partial [Draconibacterium sp.]|nr:methyltransferase domain-containing protein [Draconibacterium sp.]